jgi:hypothetical protein
VVKAVSASGSDVRAIAGVVVFAGVLVAGGVLLAVLPPWLEKRLDDADRRIDAPSVAAPLSMPCRPDPTSDRTAGPPHYWS